MPTRINIEGQDGQPSTSRAAWATLVTGEKYLPGLAVFSESLLRGSKSHAGSKYPLVAMVTSDVSQDALDAIVSLGCLLQHVERLSPEQSLKGKQNHAQAHFQDVWTKLRAFELVDYERIVMVDSDMLVRRNMDELMDLPMQDDEIMASFACTCNPTKNPNYPDNW
jgi:alpha-N-acetylglucosamine transferase